MLGNPSRIDPPGCGCTDCHTGYSQPFDSNGEPGQFNGLLHGHLIDATGDEPGSWMRVAADTCADSFAEWIAREITSGRLLSRIVLQAKASALVLGTLLDT